MKEPFKLAIVSTHVIQHFPAMYRRLAAQGEVRPTVLYCSRSGLESYVDPGYGVTVSWHSDLLSGYDHRFLAGSERPLGEGFWANDTPDLDVQLRDLRPDVIFVYGYNQAMMLRALWFGLRHRIPVLMMSDSELIHHRALWKRTLKAAVLPPLLARMSGFLTTGDNNEKYLERYGVGRERLFRGALATDEERFLAMRETRDEASKAMRAKWNVAADDFVALCVGKFVPRKRAIDLLQAVIRLSRRPSLPRKVVAVFAGDGELRGELESALRASGSDCARFIGFVNQPDLPATYAAADVLVHPAVSDAHPLTITESAMVGLPVIVSDRVGCIGPTDTARPGKNALVFPAMDVDALADRLAEVVSNPEQLRAMRDATAVVARETGVDACVDGIVRAVEALARPRSPKRASNPHDAVHG